ncbi:MAG: TerB family tellurite resistance protein [Planktotalea sp.]|uniref:tellurite resistance TerB family protein n=1 Tax=Planktotalea sp. TaxID=2029877 RepID=UPI003C732286
MPVLERLTKLFKAHPAPLPPKPLPEADVPHALGALLVRIALSDNHYAVQEISQIDRILSRFQGIGPIDAAKLRAECERLEAFAPDTPDFAYLLCESVPYDTRLEMVSALWEVVFADGALQQAEDDMMVLTQDHLGIRTEDCDAAREAAKLANSLSS